MASLIVKATQLLSICLFVRLSVYLSQHITQKEKNGLLC